MSRQRGSRAASVGWLLAALSAAMLFVSIPGCGGCRSADDNALTEEQKKKEEAAKKKAKKPEFVFRDLETLPSEGTASQNFVKPGHAVTAWVSALANYEDLRAELETYVSDVSNRPIPVGDTRYHIVMSRPAVLPKGQEKFLESTFFIPVETAKDSSNVFLQHKLKAVRGGRMLHENAQIARQMPFYQHTFVVLSKNPNAFGYLKQIESISPSHDELLDEESRQIFYRVVLPSIEQRVPLPSHPFSWTTIAYLLWDGLPPGDMTPDQQAAMVDWLHWGGQLIVSGPGSLEPLAGSFLEPYLPATGESAVALGPSDFAALNQAWSLTPKGTSTRLTLNVQETSPLVGVRLVPRPGGELMEETGGLVAERRVGRGRVVVTAFSLASPDVVNWGSFDSFFNACILRRPSRIFTASRLGALQSDWFGLGTPRVDPRILTATRYFTRDVGLNRDVGLAETSVREPDWHLDGAEPNTVSGLGGWNDKSGASSTAHGTLQAAAGISIPKASFVLGVLVVYLFVLVPVNWGVFRLLGRVEWAWIAAPVIAIVGAIAVIRLAQLDIGFVRSRTEIGVLEVHGGYPRAHLTRYIALYSSLSSNYELCFEDTSALARPFPPTESPDRSWPVTFRRDRDVRLSGFQVRSNSTGFVHGEQMIDLGGAIELVGERPLQWQIQNGSELNLRSVGVMYRGPGGAVFTSWLDRLPSKTTAGLTFQPSVDNRPWLPQWDQRAENAADTSDPAADLKDLTELAALGTLLRTGEVRMVGWSDGLVPGLTISPSASQTKARSVVLAHLRQGSLPLPAPDQNLPADVPKVVAAEDALDSGLNTLPEATENPSSND